MGNLGTAAIYVAIPLTLYGIIAMVLSVRPGMQRWADSARMAVYGLLGLSTVASGAMVYLLVKSDFSYSYVGRVTDRALDTVYKVAALWAGNEGSLLLWWWVLMALTALLCISQPAGDKELRPWATAALLVNGLFFVTVLTVVSPPFKLAPETLRDGSGMNPMLQNPGMLLHPVFLYLGYVGFAIPWAYAMAALITGKVDAVWIKVTRRWTLLAWLFLGVGIVYGGQWAYVELGWGGYWAWDPVENASIMPWFTGTAFLHSVMIQERRGMLKIWNVGLATTTFMLTLFGTFLTRSGILQSVHAFADGSLGAFFLGFIGLCFMASLYLILDRLPVLKADAELEGSISKESTFLLNNLVFSALTFAVLWGTMFPIISEWVTNQRVGVGPPFFNQVAVPLGLIIVVLMGIGPVIAWRRASAGNLKHQFMIPVSVGLLSAVALAVAGIREIFPLLGLSFSAFVFATIVQEYVRGTIARRKMTGENWITAVATLTMKNRRRYGGYIVHTAILMMTVGIIGSNAYKLEGTQTLKVGQTMQVGQYTFKHLGMGEDQEGDKQYVYADIELYDKGVRKGVMRPEKIFSPKQEQPSTEVAIRGGLVDDVYAHIGGWDDDGAVTLQVAINPLIAWIWIGLYTLMAGTLLSMWPEPLPVTSNSEVNTRAQGTGMARRIRVGGPDIAADGPTGGGGE